MAIDDLKEVAQRTRCPADISEARRRRQAAQARGVNQADLIPVRSIADHSGLPSDVEAPQ